MSKWPFGHCVSGFNMPVLHVSWTLTLAAGAPYCDGVLIAIPLRSARPQLCRTLAIVSAPTSSTSPNRSVSIMIGWPCPLTADDAATRQHGSNKAVGMETLIVGV